MSSKTPQGILDEMIDYYRARAGESAEWGDRRGGYDRGRELHDRWLREREQVYAAFDAVGFAGHVLELAPGNWDLDAAASPDGHHRDCNRCFPRNARVEPGERGHR